MIYDNKLGIFTNTPINQIPQNELNVRYIELDNNQIERYNENPNDISYIITGIATPKSLDTLKGEKRALLSNYINNLKETGFTDNITNITLSGEQNSYTRIEMLSQRLNVKANAGALEGHTQMFTDINGSIQQLDGLACLQLLDRYADWYEGLYFSEMSYNNLINSAVNETELNNITFG